MTIKASKLEVFLQKHPSKFFILETMSHEYYVGEIKTINPLGLREIEIDYGWMARADLNQRGEFRLRENRFKKIDDKLQFKWFGSAIQKPKITLNLTNNEVLIFDPRTKAATRD